MYFYGSCRYSFGSFGNIVYYNGSILGSKGTIGEFYFTLSSCPNDNLYIYFLGDGGFDIYNNNEDIWIGGPMRYGGANVYASCWLYSTSIMPRIASYKFYIIKIIMV